MEQEDFSPKVPFPRYIASKLDPFKPEIDQWLLDDEKCRTKQRHTAQRVFNRLKEFYHDEFNCSYPTVVRYVHLAVALGVRACELGFNTRFFPVAALVTRLSEGKHTGALEKTLKELEKADLIILDEWGYLPMDREEAQLLFQVITSSYERRSLIITTNLEFSKWGSIFTDDQMAAAMIDRLAHHGHLILFEGESYRLKNALMRQK